MSRKIEFFVPGTPVGKGRPRAARRGAGVVMFTPEKTADYEALVAATAAAALPGNALAHQLLGKLKAGLRVSPWLAHRRELRQRRHPAMRGGGAKPGGQLLAADAGQPSRPGVSQVGNRNASPAAVKRIAVHRPQPGQHGADSLIRQPCWRR